MFVGFCFLVTNLRIVLFSAFFLCSLFLLFFCQFVDSHSERRSWEQKKKEEINALSHSHSNDTAYATPPNEKRRQIFWLCPVYVCVSRVSEYLPIFIQNFSFCLALFFFSRGFGVDRTYVCYFVSHTAFIARFLFRSARTQAKHSFMLFSFFVFFYFLFRLLQFLFLLFSAAAATASAAAADACLLYWGYVDFRDRTPPLPNWYWSVYGSLPASRWSRSTT